MMFFAKHVLIAALLATIAAAAPVTNYRKPLLIRNLETQTGATHQTKATRTKTTKTEAIEATHQQTATEAVHQSTANPQDPHQCEVMARKWLDNRISEDLFKFRPSTSKDGSKVVHWTVALKSDYWPHNIRNITDMIMFDVSPEHEREGGYVECDPKAVDPSRVIVLERDSTKSTPTPTPGNNQQGFWKVMGTRVWSPREQKVGFPPPSSDELWEATMLKVPANSVKALEKYLKTHEG